MKKRDFLGIGFVLIHSFALTVSHASFDEDECQKELTRWRSLPSQSEDARSSEEKSFWKSLVPSRLLGDTPSKENRETPALAQEETEKSPAEAKPEAKKKSSFWGGLSYEDEKRELRTEILVTLEANTPESRALRDWMNLKFLESIYVKQSVHTLLLGNANESSTLTVSEAVALAQTLANRGFIVFYDFDSTLGPSLELALGSKGIGISGRVSRNDGRVLLISNPYLRMRAFAKADKVIATSDSVVGAGLLINGDLNAIIDPQKNLEESWFARFVKEAKPALGLKEGPFNRMIRNPLEWASEQKGKSHDPAPVFEATSTLEKMYLSDLKDLKRYGRVLIRGQQLLTIDPQSNRPIPGGAVVFGSASSHEAFTDLVYDSTRALALRGVPIATGGSGGYMEVANMAAYDAGAISIGIPYGGSEKLLNESSVASALQTLTVATQGYETRIPLLLHRRQLIVVAPGGSGTMKELASAFVMLGSRPAFTQEIVFLSSSYYGLLADGLQNTPLPKHFKSAITVVDESSEMSAVAQALEQKQGLRLRSFRETITPQPRSTRDRFERPKYYYRDDDDDKDDEGDKKKRPDIEYLWDGMGFW